MSTEDDSQDAGQWLEPLSDVAEKKKSSVLIWGQNACKAQRRWSPGKSLLFPKLLGSPALSRSDSRFPWLLSLLLRG